MNRVIHYDIEEIKNEVRQLVEQGALNRQQPIYQLCQYVPEREWVGVECELERYDCTCLFSSPAFNEKDVVECGASNRKSWIQCSHDHRL